MIGSWPGGIGSQYQINSPDLISYARTTPPGTEVLTLSAIPPPTITKSPIMAGGETL